MSDGRQTHQSNRQAGYMQPAPELLFIAALNECTCHMGDSNSGQFQIASGGTPLGDSTSGN